MLCADCAHQFRADLNDVADLIAQLDVTRSRQDQLIGPYDGGPGGETPLPYRPHVSEVVWVLHNTLTVWVATIAPRAVVDPTPTAHARWMTKHLDAIQRHTDAATLVDEITAAIRHARKAIDRPDDPRQYLGPCYTGPCREEVYGLPWHTTATCPACGATHHIIARQTWLYQQAQNHLGSAIEISGFLRIIGVNCTPSMIHNYAARKRLIPAGYRPPSSHLYRIRDVITTIEDRYRHRKHRN